MFLSKDDLDGGFGERQPLASPSSQAYGGGDDAGGGRPGSAAGRPGSAYGRPGSGGGAGEEDGELATPMSAAALRQKMLAQRQRTIDRQRTAGAVAGGGMVMGNQAMPSSEAQASRPGTAMGGAPSPLGRSAGSMGFPNPDQPAVGRGVSSPVGAGASSPAAAALESAMSRMSLDEQDGSGLVMPAPVASPEEEARRRSHLAQELDERGISPVYDPTPVTGRESSFDVASIAPSEMKRFLHDPTPKHAGMIECRITRDRTGLKLFPKYKLETESGVFLMAAQKEKHNKTSNYTLSMSRADVTKDNDNFLGKLRSNFLGLEFTAFGPGLNPKKIDPTMSQVHAVQLARQELAGVQYSSSLWGSKPRGPRKMSTVIPRVQPSGERLVCHTLHPDTEGLLALQKANALDQIDLYQNKPPKWNEQIGAFVLNFNKRVTQASVKNFQLTSAEDPDTVYLQFGRVGKEEFNMDFRYPLSPFQAFAICLSSFDNKLCCD